MRRSSGEADIRAASTGTGHPITRALAFDNSIAAGLGLLASAIAARGITVTTVDTPMTYTDGETIYIDRWSSWRDARDAVALHAAMLAADTFARSIVRRLSVHRSRVGSRYLALEAARVAHRFEAILPNATVMRVHATCGPERSRSWDESFRRALSREAIPSPPPWIGALRTWRLLQQNADLGTDRSRDAVDDVGEGISDDGGKPTRPRPVLETSSALVRAAGKLLGSRRTESTTRAHGSEFSIAGRRVSPAGRHGRAALLSWVPTAHAEPSPREGTRYPEWNVTKQAYRPAWCLVTHCEPGRQDTGPSQYPGDALHRTVARVGLTRTQHLRQSEGDTLDFSALVEHAIDRRLGDLGDPRIFTASRHTQRDLSVLVLLDSSGSTAEGCDGQTVFELERRLAHDLTLSLENLGDRVATYGFNSHGRESVRFIRVKEVYERFDTAARRRLQSIEPTGFTRFGAALRHAARLIESQATSPNMIVIYIGDGLPYDDGYDGGYARADSHFAIRETILRGVGVVGLAIRSSTEPAVLQDIWSIAPFRVVTNTHDARNHLRGMLIDALRATRTNGRVREAASADHLQAALALRRGTVNSYV